MRIDIKEIPKEEVENLRGGKGIVTKQTLFFEEGGILRMHVPVGASAGDHPHDTEHETAYILSGEARILCDGEEEFLEAGMVHHCPKGSHHSIENIGEEDLEIIFAFA